MLLAKLMVDAGKACAEYHCQAVKEVKARHVQCDEIWAFCYAKAKNAPHANGVIDTAGSGGRAPSGWEWMCGPGRVLTAIAS